MNLTTIDNGLDGVPVCTSDISLTTLGSDGKPILMYKGYSIYDLVKGLFEESVYLLVENKLPDKDQLESFSKELNGDAWLDAPIIEHMQNYPKGVHMMDFLMTALSYARMFDKDYHNTLWQIPKNDARLANFTLNASMRLGAKIPTIIANGYRLQMGKDPIPPDSSLSYAANFLHMMDIKLEEEVVNALNVILVLYLDHTINCSTFTSMVIESAMTDPYGPLLAAGAALKGVRHGGANELAADMFDEIEKPENAEAYIQKKLKNKEIVFGFGHRLAHYKHKKESRVLIAEKIGRPLLAKKGLNHYFEIYDILSEIMLKEKDRTPNADLPICLLFKAIGIPRKLNTPIFQASRHFGWTANNLRQRRDNGPLYRPKQNYNGPGADEIKTYIPLEKR